MERGLNKLGIMEKARFTERDIELWRKWMDIETVYARGKFKDEENQGHMEEGINRGVFNWGASASGYMGRALDMREVQQGYPDGFDRSKLKVSRDFGKSAHNHCVCAVFAPMYFCGVT